MEHGIFLPNFGPFFDPRVVADLAAQAEETGWDGFFIWDHILFDAKSSFPVVDPWVALAAAAMQTTRIRLGTLMTPLARRRPWKVARESVSIDHLSGGRLIFGAGLGFPPVDEFGLFGENQDDLVRAAKLDEALRLLDSLWSGKEVSFRGEEYQVGPVTFRPQPLQEPRIPVWIAAWWPHKAPLRRAAQWDGVFPERVGGDMPTPDDIADLLAYIKQFRTGSGSYDVVVNGYASQLAAKGGLAAYADAGVTWWLERIDPGRAFSVEDAKELIARSPVSL